MVTSKSIGINNIGSDGYTPIIKAATHDHIETVIALIKAGADLNKASNNGVTPLFMACRYASLHGVPQWSSGGSECSDQGGG